jgi:hypothetical protein
VPFLAGLAEAISGQNAAKNGTWTCRTYRLIQPKTPGIAT